MRSAEGRGRTLDEAVDAALIELGESRRNVDVKVVSESSDETVVEVSLLEPAAAARSSVEQLLGHMGVRATVTVRSADEDSIVVDISGRDLGMLIGWRGETLRALQTITNLVVSRR